MAGVHELLAARTAAGRAARDSADEPETTDETVTR
jgi:hypothetical protein